MHMPTTTTISHGRLSGEAVLGHSVCCTECGALCRALNQYRPIDGHEWLDLCRGDAGHSGWLPPCGCEGEPKREPPYTSLANNLYLACIPLHALVPMHVALCCICNSFQRRLAIACCKLFCSMPSPRRPGLLRSVLQKAETVEVKRRLTLHAAPEGREPNAPAVVAPVFQYIPQQHQVLYRSKPDLHPQHLSALHLSLIHI